MKIFKRVMMGLVFISMFISGILGLYHILENYSSVNNTKPITMEELEQINKEREVWDKVRSQLNISDEEEVSLKEGIFIVGKDINKELLYSEGMTTVVLFDTKEDFNIVFEDDSLKDVLILKDGMSVTIDYTNEHDIIKAYKELLRVIENPKLLDEDYLKETNITKLKDYLSIIKNKKPYTLDIEHYLTIDSSELSEEQYQQYLDAGNEENDKVTYMVNNQQIKVSKEQFEQQVFKSDDKTTYLKFENNILTQSINDTIDSLVGYKEQLNNEQLNNLINEFENTYKDLYINVSQLSKEHIDNLNTTKYTFTHLLEILNKYIDSSEVELRGEFGLFVLKDEVLTKLKEEIYNKNSLLKSIIDENTTKLTYYNNPETNKLIIQLELEDGKEVTQVYDLKEDFELVNLEDKTFVENIEQYIIDLNTIYQTMEEIEVTE